MRSLEEIKKRVKWTKQIGGNVYGTEINMPRWSGSVLFGFDEGGWEHVSVAPYGDKTPTWDDMCVIKDIFWEDEEVVIQIHPKKSEYVNIAENCLHLWRHKYIELPK